MSTTVDFIFDFGSPNAYFAYKALPPIVERAGAELNLVPCLLGGVFKLTGNQSPLMAFADVKGKLAYDQLEMQRFIKKHHLSSFQFNPHFPVNTLLMMRGAVAARMDGVLPDYVRAGFAHMWEDGLKMDDPSVFAAAMTRAGLDGDALLARTQDPAVKATLAEETSAVVERGVFGVPTVFVGEEMFFGKERLPQIAEELSARA
ncbi:MAG: 2-hydroxychromene-2-carboxylate isomerase [Caulobacterales bacterium]|nr:2-hydroxychromene-2-carboxylate isomerase [Caulobacterales bacterium]